MKLNVGMLLTALALTCTSCTFSVPVQTNTGSEEITNTPEVVADELVAVQAVRTDLPAEPAQETLEPIVLPISIYILDDDGSELSSARTVEGLEEVYQKVNSIWAQAGIVLAVQTIHRVTVTPEYLQSIAVRDFRFFFQGIGDDIELPEPSLLNGFYAQDIGGPNGITPFGSRAFFVTDVPSVHSERVSSHEIGHILGLHHVLDDPNRLMFSGTNGMLLSEEEIIVARYAAQGLLDGVR